MHPLGLSAAIRGRVTVAPLVWLLPLHQTMGAALCPLQSFELTEAYLREGGMPTVDSFMASGPFSKGWTLGGGGGPLLGCLRRKSWLGVCPKWLIWSSTALRCLHACTLTP